MNRFSAQRSVTLTYGTKQFIFLYFTRNDKPIADDKKPMFTAMRAVIRFWAHRANNLPCQFIKIIIWHSHRFQRSRIFPIFVNVTDVTSAPHGESIQLKPLFIPKSQHNHVRWSLFVLLKFSLFLNACNLIDHAPPRCVSPSLMYMVYSVSRVTWQWRHNGNDNVSNHQPYDCLLNRLFRRRSTKTSKLRV